MPVLCVFCRRQPVDPRWRPFCSDRCRIQDLARWADGSYAVPGEALIEPGEVEHSDADTQKD
ncbi:MAG: DNA gyrase inhibitor YacG [Acidobacteriota bacterium]